MAEGGKSAKDVFKKTLPKLINVLGKDPSFSVVTASLNAEDLITDQELEAIMTKQVDNATLKKHGESMRTSISNGTAATPVQVPAVTPSAPPYPSAAALPRTNPNELGIGDLDIVLSVLANELVPTATVSSNGSSRSTSSTSMQTASTSNTDNGKRTL
uniref:Uncharacterized protein n=1 Tax=Amphimedon queenslandica TaxID=400682 RepID=A0A1X7TQR2_AMPQE